MITASVCCDTGYQMSREPTYKVDTTWPNHSSLTGQMKYVIPHADADNAWDQWLKDGIQQWNETLASTEWPVLLEYGGNHVTEQPLQEKDWTALLKRVSTSLLVFGLFLLNITILIGLTWWNISLPVSHPSRPRGSSYGWRWLRRPWPNSTAPTLPCRRGVPSKVWPPWQGLLVTPSCSKWAPPTLGRSPLIQTLSGPRCSAPRRLGKTGWMGCLR